jgi:hypothetical protein
MTEKQSQKVTSGLTVFELSQLEKFLCHPINTKVLEDTLREYFEGTFTDYYPRFYKQLSTNLGLPTDTFKISHFYFLVTINNDQRLFQYRTDRLFRWHYKQSLKDLLTYLKYAHRNNIKIDIQVYTIPISHDEYLKTNYFFKKYQEKISGNTSTLTNIFNWIGKRAGSILSFIILIIFPLFLLGKIIISMNIPFDSLSSNFFSLFPVALNFSIANSFPSPLKLILLSFPVILYFVYLFQTYRKIHIEHITNTISIFALAVATSLLISSFQISTTNLPIHAYIEATGYPKIIQSNEKNYTLLGSDNMVYDLNKSLTLDRCTQLIELDQNQSINEFYFRLIKQVDNITIPRTSIKIKDDNMTYFDYNQSRIWVESQCKNILSSTSKTKVTQ